MATDSVIKDQMDEEQGWDEPDHEKAVNVPTAPARESSKIILKVQDENVLNLKRKPTSSVRLFRSSIYGSSSSVGSARAGTVAIFGTLIVLKVIFVDIWTSLGDAVTDFLQGFFLMFDFQNDFAWKEDTYQYGIIVLIACWVPGIVAVIHMLAYYRKKSFVLMVFFCFFFYPFVPTLAYIANLWHMNGAMQSYNAHAAELELFARVTHSITGCIEAPFQLIMTSWLIMKGVLDIPWRSTLVDVDSITDRFENQIPIFSIPMWTLCFSFLDIICCSIQMNIFNVYVGQLRNVKSFKRYLNLVGGHFPFFFHAVCFRIITFAFLMIYLDTFAAIPLFIIWISNLIIGYTTVANHKLPRSIRSNLKRMQSQARRNANLPKILPNVERKKNNENTPVWLNSFLSIFVPSCFVHTADPALLLETEGLTKEEKEKHDEIKQAFFECEKIFQNMVIKYQVQTSTTFLMISSAIVFFLVNYTAFKYNNNIFSNEQFNILCCVIFGLGVISFLFLSEIDIFNRLHLNDKAGEKRKITIKYEDKRKNVEDLGEDEPDGVKLNIELEGDPDEIEFETEYVSAKKHGSFKKTMVSILCTLLAISPIIAGIAYSNIFTNNPAYFVIKVEQNETINIWMAKSRILNNPTAQSKLKAEGLLRKCECEKTKKDLLICQTQNQYQDNHILLVDMNSDCLGDLSTMDDIECLPYKAIVLMENWDNRSSRPVNFNSNGVKKFPIISISNRDSKSLSKHLKDFQYVNIIFDDFGKQFEDSTADIYEINCPRNGCTSMGYPKMKTRQKYIGCDGEVKLRSEVKMFCTSQGRRCPELETWKLKIEKDRLKFESCFQMNAKEIFPPPHCVRAVDGKEKMPKSCDQEESFWTSESTLCWKPESKTVKYWRKECGNEVECSQWGSWSNWINTICTQTKPIKRFRFCRKREECVLMELEKKYKDGNATCTKDDFKENYDTEDNGIHIQVKDCVHG